MMLHRIATICMCLLLGLATAVSAAPIHDAVKTDDQAKIRTLLLDRANTELKDGFGETPLHLAARFGHVSAASILLENGANIHAENSWGETPLQLALLNYQKEINLPLLKVLLAHGADPNRLTWSEKATFVGGKSEVVVFELLAKAGLKVRYGGGPQSGMMVLLARNASPETFRILGKCNDKNDGMLDGEYYNAVSAARRAKRNDVVEALYISSSVGTRQGLLDALRKSDLDAFERYLRDGVNPFDPGETGLLMQEVNRHKNPGFLLALESYGDKLEKRDEARTDAKHDDPAGAPPKSGRSSGQPASFVELKKGLCSQYLGDNLCSYIPHTTGARFIDIIVEAKGDINATDEKGRALFHECIISDAPDYMLKEMHKLGADIDIMANNGIAPIHLAIANGKMEAFKALLNMGAKTHLHDDPLKDPLLYAVLRGKYKMAEILVKHGADVNVSYGIGLTPLHLAASARNIDFARTLVDAGAKLDAADKYGMTPVHAAAVKGSLPMSKFLKKAGANVTLKNSWGQTPSVVAKEAGFRAVASYLEP